MLSRAGWFESFKAHPKPEPVRVQSRNVFVKEE